MSQELTGFLIERCELLGDDPFERARQLVTRHLSDDPLLTDQRDLLVPDELAQDLPQEERVPLDDLSQLVLEVLGHPDRWKERLDMSRDVRRAQGCELDLLDLQLFTPGAEETLQRRHLLTRIGGQRIHQGPAHEHGYLVAGRQHPQEIQGCVIDEVQVIDQQDEWTRLEGFRDQSDERIEDVLPPEPLVLLGLVRLSLCELGQDMGGVRKLLRAQIVEHREPLVGSLIEQGHQNIGRQVVRAKELLLAAAHLDHLPQRVLAELAADSLEEGALAHPGCTLNQEKRALAKSEPVESIGDPLELGSAPDDLDTMGLLQGRLGEDLPDLALIGHGDAVSTRVLCTVEGHVGLADQVLGIPGILRRRRHADAQTQFEIAFAATERLIAEAL